MKIRSYLILLIVAVVLPLAVLLAYTIREYFQRAEQDAHALLTVQSEFLATNISNKLEYPSPAWLPGLHANGGIARS